MNGEGFVFCDLTYCPVCGGSGNVYDDECFECGGSGLNPYYEHKATVERVEERDDHD